MRLRFCFGITLVSIIGFLATYFGYYKPLAVVMWIVFLLISAVLLDYGFQQKIINREKEQRENVVESESI